MPDSPIRSSPSGAVPRDPPPSADADSTEERRFGRAFRDAPIGMALVDPDGSLLAVNRALCTFLGRGSMELLELGLMALTHPDEATATAARVQAALDGGPSSYAAESRYLRPDGTAVWADLSVSLVRGGAGEKDYFIVQMVDTTASKATATELRRYTARLEGLTAVDALTGLGNGRALTEALDRELHRCQRHGGRFCLALITLEGGELVRRSRGPASHDESLRTVANVLGARARLSDLAARTGEHEFTVLLPETGREGAERFLERLTEELDDLPEPLALSTGIADYPAAGTTRDLLTIRAEMDLYAHRRGPTATPPQPDPGVARVLELSRSLLDVQLEYRTAGEAVAAERTGARSPVTSQDVPVCLPDGRRHGTLRATAGDPRGGELAERLLPFLATLIGERVEQDRLEHDTRRVEAEVSGMYALVAALAARDHSAVNHSARVVALAGAVAASLGLDDDARRHVEHVAMLRDIGKVGLPDALLGKQGPLSAQERQLMSQHPMVGARVLEASPSLAHLAPATRAGNERWDGAGDPDGLRGTAIPLASRIVLACRIYQAMTAERPAQDTPGEEPTRERLREGAGGRFDPMVVDAVLAVLAGDGTARDGLRAADSTPDAVLLGSRPTPESLWSPLGDPGRGRIMGEVRASCEQCGAHVAATISPNGISGCCGTCGSYELTLPGS